MQDRTPASASSEKDKAEAFLGTHDIQTVICAVPDLWGRLVGKRLTRRSFERAAFEDEALNASIYIFCVDIDMEPQTGYAATDWARGFQDCRFLPDLSTLRLVPWADRTAMVLCDVRNEETGELLDIAPRTILKKQIERARNAGLTFKFATELEFFLFENDLSDAWAKKYEDLTPVSRYRADYHIFQSAMDEGFIGKARDLLLQADVEVEFSKTEWGLGQQEINLRYADTLEMADQHVLYKGWMKELAGLDGKTATFMPKPYFAEVGSSCHVHVSLWDAETGAPAGWDAGAPNKMSKTFSAFIGGLAAASSDMMVFYAPTVNAYKRLQPESFAPIAIAVGLDNRTCAYRLVGSGPSFRVENRVPGADANPYLVLAGMIASGLHGIGQGLAAPEIYAGNAYTDPRLKHVPATLGEAVGCFGASDIARSAFGDAVHAHLVNFYRHEYAAYENGCVTDWERVRYFERI